MGYSLNQIKEWIERKEGVQTLSSAIKQEKKIRFHVESTSTPDSFGLENFLSLPKTLLPRDKYKTFLESFTKPVATCDFSSDLVDYFLAVFRGKDKFIRYVFNNEDDQEDFEEYLKKSHYEKKFIAEGFKTFKSYINSIVIVDQPSEAISPPEPYFVIKRAETIQAIHYEKGPDFKIDFVAVLDVDRICVYDDEKYVSYPIREKKIMFEEAEVNFHDLGRIPVQWFWYQNAYLNIKEHVLSKELGNLNRLLFREISKDVADLYIPFPMSIVPKQECEYSDEAGFSCNSGLLVGTDGKHILREMQPLECPACGAHKLTGPGSVIKVSADSDDKVFEPKFVNADTSGIEYYAKSIETLKNKISFYTTGRVDMGNEQAKNEKQVLGSFETQTNTLFQVKKNFEIIWKWTTETIAELRYDDSFNASVVNLGTEFMIYPIEQLYSLYEQGRKSGFDDATLDDLKNKIIETENQNNPIQKNRLHFLGLIEPFRHKTVAEVLEMQQKGLKVDQLDLQIKTNFSNFISRFEREEVNVMKIDETKTLDQRVNFVLNKFKEYGSEKITSATTGSTDGD